MTLEYLIVRLRIEENNKAAEKKSRENLTIMGANIVEEASTSKKRKKSSGPKNYPSKMKFKGNCHNYGKVGHKATECRAPKKDKKNSQGNMIEKNDEIDDLYAILSECSLVGNPREWWIDSGATRHVCANKELFTSYAPAGPDEIFFTANSATAKIEGTGKIALKMTFGKIVTLNDVLHVPEMRKNLASTSLLVKNDNAEFLENIYPYKMECESSSKNSKRSRKETKESTFNEEIQDVVNVKGQLLPLNQIFGIFVGK
uniref:Retrovirus-related Pol polyprotein from transposon TNT 1-94-like beta-barrel domain-containing protein n=1 Tax=Nicotiana tabacum TaxID=4097 RepID=A0A1S3YLU3_TOBAC|nr:PREDICTED: uncharacterized protein LOC107777526 [Nicotiana tabacum]